MGWCTYNRPKGQTDAAHLAGEILHPTDEFVATSTIKGVFYGAVKRGEQVFAVIVLQQRTRGYDNYGYKAMDETMGPYEAAAPAKVLDALTPTDNEYANEWRAKCRENLAAKAAAPKVKKGDRIRFASPLQFGNGQTLQTLTLVERSTFEFEGRRYRIPAWRTRQWTLA